MEPVVITSVITAATAASVIAIYIKTRKNKKRLKK